MADDQAPPKELIETSWEVFVQSVAGAPHEHAGNVHAADKELALQNARDVYARRGKILSIWVVPTEQITASSPEDAGAFFEPAREKLYRQPQFYKIPKHIKAGDIENS